ncbi:hydrogenase formation protein HypD [Helicobacter sp. MIT 00-7814]|uniref:hydrogenase formation protein HypD n=1 Tax=unclassified Helicobacter TaxID=2593540 RepID=UPI000E1F7C93|nr:MULTISPECIES: hydrogenase formation protein HypD [unclassified Helicobacter]RDU51708.1 hydrogenase formation protein HypD [Helicobacter sp. MIT 00-7814]RDU52377.1 hydrogenase formation protein HypD [Helicobacter sp. MIT 99-10781]
MDLINDFRDKDKLLALSKLIISESTRKLRIMEVCGGHTHSIMKFGLQHLVGEHIEFLHGPGCPVCVMPRARIDEGLALAQKEGVIFCTLADMLRVKGSKYSLLELRAQGKDIRALYSPLDVLKIAQENPQKQVIFFAIGFETTTPMSALLVEKVLQMGIKNVLFHINHVRVPEPVCALLEDEECKIEALLAPSHVSVITGSEIYEPIARKFGVPIAVSGFEPLDILDSVLNLVRQANNNTALVYNQYARVVKKEGNLKAQGLIARYFQQCDFEWRGLGVIPQSALELKEEFSFLDARKVLDCKVESIKENKACLCPQILKGRAKPFDCKLFGKSCTPQNPLGSCMVSSEGACAAYYKYEKRRLG